MATCCGPGEAGAVAVREDGEVARALLVHEEEDADEHQRRAEHGEEHEAAGGVGARLVRHVVVAEAAHEHPHRHEDDLEGDEEEDGVARHERRERPRLDEQDAAEEGRARAALRDRTGERVRDDGDGEQRREEDERGRDAVDAEVPPDAERADPRRVHLVTSPDDDDGEHRCHDGRSERDATLDRGLTGDRDEGDRREQRQQEHQGQRHAVTPRIATSTTPASRLSSDRDGTPRWLRSPARPAARATTAVARG